MVFNIHEQASESLWDVVVDYRGATLLLSSEHFKLTQEVARNTPREGKRWTVPSLGLHDLRGDRVRGDEHRAYLQEQRLRRTVETDEGILLFGARDNHISAL